MCDILHQLLRSATDTLSSYLYVKFVELKPDKDRSVQAAVEVSVRGTFLFCV